MLPEYRRSMGETTTRKDIKGARFPVAVVTKIEDRSPCDEIGVDFMRNNSPNSAQQDVRRCFDSNQLTVNMTNVQEAGCW